MESGIDLPSPLDTSVTIWGHTECFIHHHGVPPTQELNREASVAVACA